MLRLFWIITFFTLLMIPLRAQSSKWQKILGLQLLKSNQYAEAITTLKTYHQNYNDDDEVLLAIAICSYHLNDITATEQYLNFLKQRGSVKDKKLILYDARVHYAKGEYVEAINLYKTYLRKEKQPLNLVKQELMQCANALKIRPPYIEYQHLKESLPINSPFNDYGLMLSPTQNNRYYFTSDRNGNDDIFLIDSSNVILQLEKTVNTSKKEILAGFSDDGNTIYFLREDTLQYVSILTTDKNRILPNFYIYHPFWYKDTIIFFSSNQLGGYGGYDLFFILFKNGKWTMPNNLGNIVNTIFDEQYPFLATDGQTLFFSTNHPQLSIGGMDIVYSQFKPTQKTWQEPIPLTAINTYADETHFFLVPPNNIFYTTNHWRGIGGKDIFSTKLSPDFTFSSKPLFFNDLIKIEDTLETHLPKLIYRIFITKKTTSGESIAQEFSDVFIQKDNAGYNYYVGGYQSFFSALELLTEIEKRGWKAAKIVIFFNDVPLKEEEVELIFSQYPDIKNYLEYKRQ